MHLQIFKFNLAHFLAQTSSDITGAGKEDAYHCKDILKHNFIFLTCLSMVGFHFLYDFSRVM